tara:strand:+ start:114 stop:854 length:741 start_codon:yes stop_codon:yes gene_type:complete
MRVSIFLIALSSIASQTIRIADLHTGKPIENVNVFVEGNGLTSDINGFINLDIFSKNNKITFSMIGYRTIMLPIFEIQDFVYLEKESIPLDVVDVIGKSKNSKKKFNRIERDVRKVYPYAKKTSELLNDYSSIIDSLEQYSGIKRYVRKRKIFSKIEDELILKYGHSIKKLKRRQGRILIRLIDRETGRTSYDIIKDFRNIFSASFWQLTAKVFGHDLQSVFGQGKKEDIFIEYVIKKIENEKLYN